MHDEGRHRIAFHVLPSDADPAGAPEPERLDHFVIGDDDFEPSAA
jgi:hypothetical protein